MKKSLLVVFVLVFSLGPLGFAMTPDEARKAHYEEVKKLRETQRQNRSTSVSTPGEHKETFWDREAKRAGFADTGNNVTTLIKNLNPVPFFKSQQERYEARRAAAVK